MSIKATVTQNGLTTAKVTPQQNVLVTNYRVNSNSLNLEDLSNIAATSPLDGAMLVYNAATQVWEARSVIDSPNTELNGGFY